MHEHCIWFTVVLLSLQPQLHFCTSPPSRCSYNAIQFGIFVSLHQDSIILCNHPSKRSGSSKCLGSCFILSFKDVICMCCLLTSANVQLYDLLLLLQRHMSILCLQTASCCSYSILPPSPGSMTPRASVSSDITLWARTHTISGGRRHGGSFLYV